jgi:hypothetical protein
VVNCMTSRMIIVLEKFLLGHTRKFVLAQSHVRTRAYASMKRNSSLCSILSLIVIYLNVVSLWLQLVGRQSLCSTKLKE